MPFYFMVTSSLGKEGFLKIIEASYLEYSEVESLDYHHHLPEILKTLTPCV